MTEIPRQKLSLKQVREFTPPAPATNGARRSPPIRDLVREFQLPNGRKLTVHKHTINGLVEADPNQFNGRATVIIAFRLAMKPCPVLGEYEDVKAWWLS